MISRVFQRWHLEDAVRRLDYPVGHLCHYTFEATITEATLAHRAKQKAALETLAAFDLETAAQ